MKAKVQWASTWEETLIKSKQIRWNSVKPKSTDDGLLDFDIHLPLTNLFRAQARRAFMHGMMKMLLFHIDKQTDQKLVEVSDLVALFEAAGLPEIAAGMSQLIEGRQNEPR